jgi:hypothetical protein
MTDREIKSIKWVKEIMIPKVLYQPEIYKNKYGDKIIDAQGLNKENIEFLYKMSDHLLCFENIKLVFFRNENNELISVKKLTCFNN